MISKFITRAKIQMTLSVVATLGAAIATIFQFYAELSGTHSVVIASSPSSALIRINGNDVGQTPTTLELKRGTYTVEARLSGYEPAQHAIYVSAREANLVNIQLLPTQRQLETLSPPAKTPAVATDNAVLLDEIGKLKAALITNPEEAVSLPLIREKLRVQEELTKAVRDDLKEVKEQTKWYLGSMIAITVGMLAVIATLFVAMRGKSNA